jgi:hypothetical protein
VDYREEEFSFGMRGQAFCLYTYVAGATWKGIRTRRYVAHIASCRVNMSTGIVQTHSTVVYGDSYYSPNVGDEGG